ncbi:phenylacetate--CoA ligase family protein [Candidatus Margulisiibacteriota bacterium]
MKNTKSEFSFFSYPKSIYTHITDLKVLDENIWLKNGRKKLNELKEFTANNVPAFSQHLQKHNLMKKQVIDSQDLSVIPFITKKNYIKEYSFTDLIPKDKLGKITTFASSSGTTGKQSYFPREENQDSIYEYILELLLLNQFNIQGKKTLCILGFALGIWIGGIFSYKVLNSLGKKGHSISTVPVGNDKDLFLEILKDLAPSFDQVILLGYPPFIKEIVDNAVLKKINLKKLNIKIITAAEAFSENFRDYLVAKTGIKNKFTDIANIYGTVELGTMAHETPASVLVRNLARANKQLFQAIFPDANDLPVLTQYYPYLTFFEEYNNELIASGYGSAIPLIKYKLNDTGGVLTFTEMISKMAGLGIDFHKEAEKAKISHTIFKLPFVYISGRSDMVLVYGGANIWPENIKSALLKSDITSFVTGKFTIFKNETSDYNSELIINVELSKNTLVRKEIEEKITDIIIDTLCRENKEFKDTFSNGNIKPPKIALYSYGDKKYFSPSVKQKWMIIR